MKVEKMGDGIYNAFHRETRSYGVGETVFEAIEKCLSMVREYLYEEFLKFLAENGSNVHDIVYTDQGASFISVGEDGDRSTPLPIKYHQFL